MSYFLIGARLKIKDIEQKSKTVVKFHGLFKSVEYEDASTKYKEKITGNITVPKEVMGKIEGILERDGINRKETEYIVRVWDLKGDINKSITKNYAESYLIRYGRLLT